LFSARTKMSCGAMGNGEWAMGKRKRVGGGLVGGGLGGVGEGAAYRWLARKASRRHRQRGVRPKRAKRGACAVFRAWRCGVGGLVH
jgi:hypothetical protein